MLAQSRQAEAIDTAVRTPGALASAESVDEVFVHLSAILEAQDITRFSVYSLKNTRRDSNFAGQRLHHQDPAVMRYWTLALCLICGDFCWKVKIPGGHGSMESPLRSVSYQIFLPTLLHVFGLG